MYRFIIAVVLVCLSLFVRPAYAQSPIVPLAQRTVPQIVEYFATQYQVSATKMLNTMQCESGLNNLSIGDHGTSFGISQIHLPAHKDITIQEAENPVFASEFMAKNFAEGNQRIWTCARMLGY